MTETTGPRRRTSGRTKQPTSRRTSTTSSEEEAFGLQQPGRLLEEGNVRTRTIHALGASIREFLQPTGNWVFDPLYYSYRYKPSTSTTGRGRSINTKKHLRQPNDVTSFADYDWGLAQKYKILYQEKYQIRGDFEFVPNHEPQLELVNQIHLAAAARYEDDAPNPLPLPALAGGFLRVRVQGQLVMTNQVVPVSVVVSTEVTATEQEQEEEEDNNATGLILMTGDLDRTAPAWDATTAAAARVSLSPTTTTTTQPRTFDEEDDPSEEVNAAADPAENPSAAGSSTTIVHRAHSKRSTKLTMERIHQAISSGEYTQAELIPKLVRKIQRRDDKLEQAQAQIQQHQAQSETAKRKYQQLEEQRNEAQAQCKKLKEDLKLAEEMKFEFEESKLDWQERETKLKREILQLKKQQSSQSQTTLFSS